VDITQTPEYQQELAAQRSFMIRVYTWMAAAMLVSALGAVIVAVTPSLQKVFLNPSAFFAAIIIEMGIALGLRMALRHIPATLAAVLFILYAASLGLTTGAIILKVYSPTSIINAFVIAAAMFGTMSVYGWKTKKDLTSLGSFCIMGLWGIFLAGILSLFFGGPSPMMNFIICSIGALAFTGLTAYDTQMAKKMYAEGEEGSALNKKLAIFSAFELYTDFVYLFIYILRLLNSRD
jgi:FtsH-binding integral membrane protein